MNTTSPNGLRTVVVLLLLCAGVALPIGASGSGESGYGYGSSDVSAEEQLTLQLTGLTGALSAVVIEEALLSLDGVVDAEVSHQAKRATAEINPDLVNARDLEDYLSDFEPLRANALPWYARSAGIRFPELKTRGTGAQVNEVIGNVSGVLGGSITPGLITVDYDSRVVTAEEIAEAVTEGTDLQDSEISSPAADIPAPEDSAHTILRIEGMDSYARALEMAQSVTLEGIVDGSVDLEEETISVIYAIAELTTPSIVDAVRQGTGQEPELITIDKAGKPVGLNIHGWFVLAVSTFGLLIALAAYFAIRRWRRHGRFARSDN